MTKISTLEIDSYDGTQLQIQIDAFARLLHACVQSGASISFVQPFTINAAKDFWHQKVLPGVLDGSRILLIAKIEGQLAGCVQLDCDTPPNQPHRAEVAKLLVHPAFRRKGIARALMLALEDAARQRQRRLITLDTRTGDHAEPLYRTLGYQTVGTIPEYAKDPFTDTFDATTIMYKLIT
ncbi:acetyltransferase [Thalassospira sp. MCCC 1A01428]|nr:acetyltransferase [Thalassospira sp. MCCC 1A01428]